MPQPLSHRRMLAGLAAALPLAGPATAADPAPESPGSEPADDAREVRLEHLRPSEIDQAMKECPTLFLPLGTVEWHGLHNIVGVDAIKAHMLCVRAARRGGGLVAPPLYGGVGGLDQPHTFVMEAENDLFSVLLRPWLEQLCREAVRQGFRAVVILTGHYGAGQQMVVRETAVRMSRVLGVPILGTPEYFLALDAGYRGDHAAWGETSLMMELDPDSVDLGQLGDEPHRGVGGKDPKRFATREDGRRLAELIVDRLARLARVMPTWDAATLEGFIEAESALVNRQVVLAGGDKQAWTAWRNLGQGVFDDYGRLLADQKFEEIVALVEKL
ncbi:MAG: creatininase family protein [Thermoguttaceae bacterium]